MAKILKTPEKLFGSGAGTDQIAKFGSDFAGAPVRYDGPSATVALIQSLSNWLTGWSGAAIGGNAPCIEDVNAAHFAHSSQIGYLMQAGVAEWDAVTIYYIGSIVNDGTGTLYVSRLDNNFGNAITDALSWKRYSQEPTGSGKDFWGASLPGGYVWASGKTIGNPSSNATERANDDTVDLFNLFWSDFSDGDLPIFTSAGAPSTRGVSAASDYAANKAISVPDKRGRVSAAADALGGTAANRLDATGLGVAATLGKAGGGQMQTLSIAQIPAHNHSGATGTENTTLDHRHFMAFNFDPVTQSDIVDTSQGVRSSPANSRTFGTGSVVGGVENAKTYSEGPSAHTHGIPSQGGGTAHENVQPTIVCNYILKL